MFRIRCAVPIPIFLFIFLAFLFTSTSTQYQVTGVLVDKNQTPVAGLSVILLDEKDEKIASDQTDNQGRFSLVYQVEATSADTYGGLDIPSEFKLGASYPNPFNPRTTVPFLAPENTRAVVALYNILGQEVMRNQVTLAAGNHDILINLGGGLSQGQYILRVQGEGFSLTQSMTFVSAGIGGGHPEIRVRSGKSPSAHIASSMKHQNTEVNYRVIVEGNQAFGKKEFPVPVNQNYHSGEIALEHEEYPLHVTIVGQGSVSEQVVTAKGYGHGTLVRLTAEPAEGWRFVEWGGDIGGTGDTGDTGNSVNNTVEITVESEKNVTATFEKRDYPLHVTIVGQGSVSEQVVTAKGYGHGTLVRLTAEPAEGWRFVEWGGDIGDTGDTGDTGNSVNNTVEITVESEKNVTATFEKREYPLHVTIVGQGSVSEQVVTAKGYGHGTLVRLTAEPAEGWTFQNWSGDLSGTDNPHEITIDSEKSVTATFFKINTNQATNVTISSANIIGEFVYAGTDSINDLGICYATTHEPDFGNTCVSAQSFAVGHFSIQATDLDDNTQYFARAYVRIGQNTTFGNQITFTTLESPKGSLSGFAYYSGTTIPTSGVTVSVGHDSSTTTTTGWFEITNINVGTYELVAAKHGYDNYVQNVTISEGENTADLPMSSTQFTHQLSGKILSASDNNPVEGASVFVLNPDGSDSELHSTTSSTGFYQIPNVPRGAVTVVARHISHEEYEIDIFMSHFDYQLDVNLIGRPTNGRDTETIVVDVTNPETGHTWMDRNLGATRAATSSNDYQAYGDLYQWGRRSDGHEKRNSPTTSTMSGSDQPAHGRFIVPYNIPWDWRSPQNDHLWQGEEGINNPCPFGYRVPTEAEWNAERLSWSSNNAAGAIDSPLKLVMAGGRSSTDGSLLYVGTYGGYWSSTDSGNYARSLRFGSSSADVFTGHRSFGRSVRCIKD